jgi:hypothetical protein
VSDSATVAPAAVGQPMLPDMFPLVSESKGYVHGWEFDLAEQPGRTLLRLTTAVANRGTGPMDLVGGAVNNDGTQQVYQRINLEGGGTTSRLAGNFIYHPQHQHIHFDGFAAYRIRAIGAGNTLGPVLAEGDKVSFCLLDVDHFNPGLAGSPPGSRYVTCGSNQGISVGWADVYEKDLPDQWIDVTGVPDGRYWLEVVADPENRLTESDETNNSSAIQIDIAKPPPDPMVVAHDPVGQYPGAASAVDFRFDQPMRTSSFSIADDLVAFTGPTGADLRGQATGFSWPDSSTLRVTFNPQPALGPYTMTIGPNILASDNGAPMDQDRDKVTGESVGDRYTATFTVDNRLGPDGFGYEARAVPVENIDLVRGAPGVSTLIDGFDEFAVSLRLGANTFNFYGNTYTGDTSVFVSTNGMIVFGEANTAFTNDDLTDYPQNPTIAVLWDDLQTQMNDLDCLLSKTEDTTGDGVPDRMILEWSDVTVHNDTGPAPTRNMTFQAILSLNTGATPGPIVFNYRDVETGSRFANGGDATVGIKGGGTQAAGGNRLLVSYNRGNNPLIGSGKAIRIARAPAEVVGRRLFYNRSAFDGGSAAANAQDDFAVATDKSAYSALPGPAGTGRASFANVSSYSRGINGVMVDIAGLYGRTPAASDVAFATGTNLLGTWSAAPAPTVSIRRGAGANGSDRVTFVWPDNAVRNTWLRVTVKAAAGTGLPAADVFYFGHLAGETGGRATSSGATVSSDDLVRTRSASSTTTVPLTNLYDHNRDGRVNGLDLNVTRSNQRRGLPWLIGPTTPSSATALPVAAAPTRDATQRRTTFLLDKHEAGI